MRAVIHDSFGSPDVLEIRDVEKPTPAADELLVRVRAASRPTLPSGTASQGDHGSLGRRWVFAGRGAHGSGSTSPAPSRRSARTWRCPAGRRCVRRARRSLRRVRLRARGACGRAEAGQRDVRASGGRGHRRHHRATGTSRPGQAPARAQGADQRRVRRRGSARSPYRSRRRSGPM